MSKISIQRIFFISAIIHIVTSFFSVGFHHFDEHFQIFEFLATKVGKAPVTDLPWEYAERMRSWFQVGVYYLVYRTLSLFSIESPFVMAIAFRLLSAMLGLFSIYTLIPYLKDLFKENEEKLKIALLFLNFTWFMPYFHVRTSGEGFSLTLFTIGAGLFLNPRFRERFNMLNAVLVGAFFCMAYLARFHAAILVAGIWFWAVFVGKLNKGNLAVIAGTIIVGIFCGIGIDYWGYGEWVFTAFNFFKVNLIDDKVSTFGVSPWYYYFRKGFGKGIPPISIFCMLITIWAWVKRPKDPFVWATIPFFVIHQAIGHKEIRFLFPMAGIMPYFMALFYVYYKDLYPKLGNSKFFNGLCKFSIGLNFVFIIVVALRAANPAINFYSYVHRNNVTKINFIEENPFTMLGLKLNFYAKKDVELNEIKIEDITSGTYVFSPRGKYMNAIEENKNCQLEFLTYPKWSLKFNVGNWVQRSRVWSLYKCE